MLKILLNFALDISVIQNEKCHHVNILHSGVLLELLIQCRSQ